MGVKVVGGAPAETAIGDDGLSVSLFDHEWPIDHAKAVLMAHLTSVDITRVTIEYDGAGDCGQIADIEAIDRAGGKFKLMNPLSSNRELADALENFAWKVLGEHHTGFENNDGGFGTITIDVTGNSVSLEKNDNFVDFHTETVGV